MKEFSVILAGILCELMFDGAMLVLCTQPRKKKKGKSCAACYKANQLYLFKLASLDCGDGCCMVCFHSYIFT